MQDSGQEKGPVAGGWLGFWSMIVQQTQNAFNDKAAQFFLISLGGAVGFAVESIAGLMIALPFVLFAPLAGWFSDRFSKRTVIIGAAIMQVAVLGLICFAILIKSMPLALVGFFLLAIQSAFFSPAKMGINKELVGSQNLGFAAGVQQMTAMLAILSGQIISGWWYDKRYISLGSETERAWDAALFPLLILTGFSFLAVGTATLIPKVPAQGGEKLTGKLLISHFKDLKGLWADSGLRRASFGVAFFWGFAAFLNLWSVKVAKMLTDGGEGFGTLSSLYMAAASLGLALGFGVSAVLFRKRIELGWVPLSAVLMTGSLLTLAFIPMTGWQFLLALGVASFAGALFLAPLNAWMQDHYPANKRGEMQSAVNLQDCFAGILSVIFIEACLLATELLGINKAASFRVQIVLATVASAAITVYFTRQFAFELIRMTGLAVVRLLYNIKVTGSERLPKTGGALLLPNHVTFADSFYLSAASDRPLRFVMDESFMSSAIIRFSARLFGTVPIRRDQPLEAIRKTIDALDQGFLVVLFPEGQLTRTGTLSELERGFELIARKAKCPIHPVWIDGSWGSIFSFERGRFIKKKPYRVPYGLSIAIGEELHEEKPSRANVQQALMKTSAVALSHRFEIETIDARANVHQLTQLDALPRGEKIAVLNGDLASELKHIVSQFAAETQTEIVEADSYDPKICPYWLGAESLREKITTQPSGEREIHFFDFSKDANTPVEAVGIIHLPCFATADRFVAFSMPHPPMPHQRSEFQAGHKPNSFGKILPGWFVEGGALQPGNIPLPDGFSVDAESFLMAPASHE